MYVIVFTGLEPNASSDQHHNLSITFKNKKNINIQFYDRNKNSMDDRKDMSRNKGDMWIFNKCEHDLPCLNEHNVHELAILNNGKDNWHIDSVVTLLSTRGKYRLLTVDMEVDRWIGKHGEVDHERFVLTRNEPLPPPECPPPTPPPPSLHMPI